MLSTLYSTWVLFSFHRGRTSPEWRSARRSAPGRVCLLFRLPLWMHSELEAGFRASGEEIDTTDRKYPEERRINRQWNDVCSCGVTRTPYAVVITSCAVTRTSCPLVIASCAVIRT